MDIAVSLVTARDGTEILQICKGDKTYRLSSLYRPEAEAEQFARQFTGLNKDSVLVVFGYGNGIFPKAVMQACTGDVKVIFYEPAQAVLQSVKGGFSQMEGVLGTRGYLVTSGWIAEGQQFVLQDQFPKLLEQLVQYSNKDKIQVTAIPKYKDIFPEQYETMLEQIRYRIRSLNANAATATVFGRDAVVNNLQNLRYVPDSYCADSFLGLFPKDMPAVIVSAGPSLEKNVCDLKQAKGHMLIAAVDSAVKYLLKEDIVPDVLISVDPLKPLDRFDDERVNGIPIAGSTDMNYRILEMLPDSKVIFSTTENTYIQKCFSYAGHQIEHLESGGSVATLAFSLCLYWGFRHIILLGQDLTLTNGRMYAGNGMFLEDSKESPMEIQDIYGNIIYTTREYYAYLKWFEQMIAMHPEVRVTDATEGGARIAGTTVMALRDALKDDLQMDFDFGACLDMAGPAFSAGEKEFVKSKIQESKENLRRLQQETEEGIALCQQALALIGQGTESVLAYSKIDRRLQEICEYYNTMEEDFVIQRQIDAVYLEEFLQLFEGMEKGSLTERYQRMKRYLEILNEADSVVRSVWDAL